MIVHYLTHDEVNAAVALQKAARNGIDLRVIDVRDFDDMIRTERLICDLDHLPAEYRTNLVSRAAAGEPFLWVAVHSYNLSTYEVRVLREAGVTVARTLKSSLLRLPGLFVRM